MYLCFTLDVVFIYDRPIVVIAVSRGDWDRETWHHEAAPDQTKVLEHGWIDGAPSRVVLEIC